jgi:hypothetical protein
MSGRFRLFVVWFAGYAASFVLLSVYAFYAVPLEDIGAVLGEGVISLTGVFAPYLTPIVAFWFAKEVMQRSQPLAEGPYKVALICSAFFNAIIVLLVASLLFISTPDPIYAAGVILQLATKVASGLAFLVGPAIGFYFGKAEPSTTKA